MFEIKHDQKTSVLNDQTLVIQHNESETISGEFSEHARDMQHQRQSYLHYDYPGRYKDNVGEDFSRWRVEALRHDAHHGNAKSSCAALISYALTGRR